MDTKHVDPSHGYQTFFIIWIQVMDTKEFNHVDPSHGDQTFLSCGY